MRKDKKTSGQFDVIVVGAGLIGAAGACLFARQGLRVALIESRALDGRDTDDADDADGRVSAIGIAAANLLKALEVWPEIDPQRVSPYGEMKVWDGNSPAKISFAAADLGQPCLGYIIDNRALTTAMMEKLRQNYQVTIMDNTSIQGIEWGGERDNELSEAKTPLRVALPDREVQTRLLVGADGGRSRVRELCGITTRFSDFAQDAIVGTISTSHEHRATAWQCFLETGPVAMLPLADGRCSLVWSCDRGRADELMALEEGAFCAQLQELFSDALGEITGCGTRQRFALAQHHADRYIADSVALIGDAAHIIHPLAGLGANLGFIDAAALAEVVERARASGGDIGQHSVLRRYERWRRGDNALVLAMMEGFKDIFGSRLSTARTIRSTGMNLVDSVTPLKTVLAKFATGLYGDIPALCKRA